MSELDQDWVQRDLDGGAVWEAADPLDVVAELRTTYHLTFPTEWVDLLGDEPRDGQY